MIPREKLLMIPGPSPVVPRILDALAAPTVSHVGPEMVRELRASCEALKQVVFCAGGEAVIAAGAGTLSMEMALLNVTDAARDRVLVLAQGYFGRRMADICDAFGVAHDVLEAEWGQVVSPEELASQLAKREYAAVLSTHVDTATGACAPVEAYAKAMAPTGALFVVDGVCATGGIPERMDAWEIDIVLTAAQKCLGAPPGLALAVFSERALAKRRSLPRIPAYYADILRWLPVMRDPAKYFSTPCVNEIRAFYEALRIILEEGLEARFARHERTGRAVRAGLAALGFTFLTDPRSLAATLSVPRYPEAVDDAAFRAGLNARGVVVAGGLAHTAGRVFRMGHMGNLASDDVVFALEAVEKTLAGLGFACEAGSAVRAAKGELTP
jgi:alanine-glyoxylate transaminase/serine-glyoxylate transaminase/serine-pyruvate transaminase